MASYLASNQPYQRVDDGIGAGLIGGALAGGALAGGLHAFGARGGLDSLREFNQNLGLSRSMRTGEAYYDRMANMPDGPGKDVNKLLEARDLNRIESQHNAIGKGIGRLEDFHSKAFGGGKLRAAGVYAGSILGGALLGAGIDAVND